MLRKGVYPSECMDSWERFDDTVLLDKKDFSWELNNEDKDYEHYKNVWEVFKIKNLGEYHDFGIHYSLQMYLKTLETSVLKYIWTWSC